MIKHAKTAQKVVNKCLLLLGLLVVSILPLLLPLEFPFPATFIVSGSPYSGCTPPARLAMLEGHEKVIPKY